MRIEEIHQPDDPRVDDFRVLKDADLLAKRGVFIAEGRLVVERLLLPSCRFGIKSLLLTPRRFEAIRPAIEASGKDPLVYLLSREAMDDVVGFHFHQGALGAGRLEDDGDVEPVLRSAIDQSSRVGTRPVVVVLEDLVDLDNVGSIFRNAAALGAGGVLLSPRCASPLYRKAIRTSMGQTLLLPFGRFSDWPRGVQDLRNAGWTVAAMTPSVGAVEIGDFVRGLAGPEGGRVAIMVGSEGEGLSVGAMSAATAMVRIEMARRVDSINVATACAIALHRMVAGDASARGRPVEA